MLPPRLFSSSVMATKASFVALGKDVYLRRPISPCTTQSADDPNVILIFGWMGAKLPHIHKYTKVYEEMYPHATQILIRSRPLFFLSPAFVRKRNIQPAVEALDALGLGKDDRLLVHSFSNGGAFQMLNLSSSLPPSSPLSRTALIIDSAPGLPTLRNAISAFSHTVPTFLQPLLILFLSFSTVWAWIRRTILRKPNEWETLFERMAKADVLPWFTEKTPRLYLYSKKDELVDWMPLQAHVRTLKGRVQEEVFEDSQHVAHARTYPERYWSAVRRVWEESKVS